MRALLSFVLLGIASSASDTFRFTQCECPDLQFFSEQQIHFPNPFELSGSGDFFQCPGNSEFPETSGVIRQPGSSAGGLQVSQVRRELFQDSLDGERNAWHAGVRSIFSPILGAQVDLISVIDEGIEVYSVSTSVLTIGGIPNVRFTINGENLHLPIEEAGEADFQIVFGETFNASINGGANTFDAAFICVSMNEEDFKCTFSDGVMAELTSVSIRLLQTDSTSDVLPTKVSMVHFESNGVNDVHGTEESDFLANLRDISEAFFSEDVPEVISLPVEDASAFLLKTDANVELDFDLLSLLTDGTLDLDLLTFSITDSTNNGVLSSRDGGSSLFKYIPLQDFTGEDAFSFNYGISSPFVCSNSISNSIIVKNQFNPPVAQNLVVDVFAGVPEILSVLVAKDLDEPDGNMDGRLLIISSSGGEITETCEDTNVATALTVTNGIASFCYSPLTSMVNGQIGSLLFTVIDGDDFSDDGSITFKGNIPIVLAPESPIKVGLEDSALIFSLGDDVFGRRAKSTFDEVPIGIRITKLPNPSLGILFDSNENVVDVIANSDFSDQDNLRFVPNAGVFNSFDELPVGPSGELIGSCDNRVLGNASYGYCEISFEYKAFFSDVESEAQRAFFLVDAVDDGNPVLSIQSTATDSSFSVVITSDAGANVFQVKMQIEGIGGSSFRVIPPDNRIGFSLLGAKISNETVEDCTHSVCNEVTLLGTPAQLQDVANNLDFEGSKGEETALSLEVIEIEQDFGDGSKIFLRNTATDDEERATFLDRGITFSGFLLGIGSILCLGCLVAACARFMDDY